MFPRIQLEGDSRERGRAYGSAARELIGLSIAGYARTFAHFAGWEWSRVRREAELFAAPIRDYEPAYLDELEGIAEGAEVEVRDVLAINVRTEIMFAATARNADARRASRGECSALTVTTSRSASGRALAAQNWDWLPHAAETVVILEVEQADRPNYVTVVEAGLLAKFGLNSARLAITTNALVSAADRGDPAVPFHVLLRALHDAATPAEAEDALLRSERAASGNYILTWADGPALDVEAAPGGRSRAFAIEPFDGVIAHSNHFISPRFDGDDLADVAMPDSRPRLARLEALLAKTGNGRLDTDFVERALRDHDGRPFSVCCHADERVPEPERSLTLASVVIDPAARTMALAPGSPCEHEFERLDFSGLLSAGASTP